MSIISWYFLCSSMSIRNLSPIFNAGLSLVSLSKIEWTAACIQQSWVHCIILVFKDRKKRAKYSNHYPLSFFKWYFSNMIATAGPISITSQVNLLFLYTAVYRFLCFLPACLCSASSHSKYLTAGGHTGGGKVQNQASDRYLRPENDATSSCGWLWMFLSTLFLCPQDFLLDVCWLWNQSLLSVSPGHDGCGVSSCLQSWHQNTSFFMIQAPQIMTCSFSVCIHKHYDL